MTEENMMLAKQEGLMKKFKLTTTVSTSNMHVFDSRGMIKKYDTPEESMCHTFTYFNLVTIPCKLLQSDHNLFCCST